MIASVDVLNALGFFFFLSHGKCNVFFLQLEPTIKVALFSSDFCSVCFLFQLGSLPDGHVCLIFKHIFLYPWTPASCSPHLGSWWSRFQSLGQIQILALQSVVDPWTSSIYMIREFVRDAESQVLPQSLPQNLHFLKTPGDLVKC